MFQRISLEKTYEQAGLMVYGNDQNFIKLSYIKVPDGTNIEFIKQANGSAIDGGAQDRSENFGATGPGTVYLKLFSDGTDLRAAYSLDGVS
jgi:regulation of enolase protein 1 (concanavalin A-like superfamily)